MWLSSILQGPRPEVRACLRGLVLLGLAGSALGGCAHHPQVPRAERLPVIPQRHVTRALASVEIVFHGEQPFVKRGVEEYPLGDVQKSEMNFSPDGRRFAFVRASSREKDAARSPHRMVVRNLAGDPVNEFPLYRPGRPEMIVWIDDRRLGYLSPAVPEEKLAAVYVVHDVQSGDVLQARSGAGFVWGPARRHIAFIAGSADKQTLVVDGKTVWPRRGTSRLHATPVWSPDGHGLALVDRGAGGTATKLVVLVEYDDPQGDLTWSIPPDAAAPSLRVFWSGDSRVVIGETVMRPRFAAGWERLR